MFLAVLDDYSLVACPDLESADRAILASRVRRAVEAGRLAECERELDWEQNKESVGARGRCILG